MLKTFIHIEEKESYLKIMDPDNPQNVIGSSCHEDPPVTLYEILLRDKEINGDKKITTLA